MLSRSSAVAKTFLSRTARRSVVARSFSSEATEAATSVSLNLSVPYDSIYNGAQVEQVIIPGSEGEYGVSANHVPYVAQMKPGILTVMFDATESEKYFVAGGYAVTHANSVTVSTEEFANTGTRFFHFRTDRFHTDDIVGNEIEFETARLNPKSNSFSLSFL